MINPCDYCCDTQRVCEHCIYGYQSKEKAYEIFVRVLTETACGEKPIGWRAAHKYIQSHPNWQEEILKEVNTSTMNNHNDVFSMPYAKWLETTLSELVKFPVKGIAINATTENGEVYTNYYEISMADKLVISGIIQQDAMLDTLAAAGYIEYANEESEEEESE